MPSKFTMAEEFRISDSNDFNKIVKRPIDLFFGKWTIIIRMSFEDPPEIIFPDVDTWAKFISDVWNGHFLEANGSYTTTADILKYCAYHTGLVGKFYIINLVLSLDNIISLLNDRLPSPDAVNVLQKLYDFASFILIDTHQKPVADISFYLDCRIPSVSDNSGRMITLFHDDDLPDKDMFLTFNIVIKYTRNDEYKLTSCIISSNTETQTSHSSEDLKDKPKELNAIKSIPSPEQTDPSTKESPDSKTTDQWQKYGAKPKYKPHLTKRYSDAIENREDERLDSSQCSSGVDPRLSEDYRRARNRSRVCANYDLMYDAYDEKDSDDHSTSFPESSGLCFPPRQIMLNVKPVSKTTSVDNEKLPDLENSRDPRLSQDSPVPSCSSESSTKHFVSPSKETESFRHLADEPSVSQLPSSKSDSAFVPFTQTPEHDLYCRKFGARIDKDGNRRCCNPFDTRTNHPANIILQSRRRAITADESCKQTNVTSIADFAGIDLRDLLKSEDELAEMPEEQRTVQKEYEQIVKEIRRVKSEMNTTSSHTGSLKETERDEQLPMEIISPPNEEEAAEIKYTRTPKLELEYKRLYIRYGCSTFFENYKNLNLPSDNMKLVNPVILPTDYLNKLRISSFRDLETASSHDCQTSSQLAIKDSDIVSPLWEQDSLNKDQEKTNQMFLQGTSDDKNEQGSSKNASVDWEPMTSGFSGEMLDSAFLSYVEEETASTSIQNLMSERSENFQTSTYKDCPSGVISINTPILKIDEEVTLDEYLDYEDTCYSSDEDSDHSDSLGHVSELEENN